MIYEYGSFYKPLLSNICPGSIKLPLHARKARGLKENSFKLYDKWDKIFKNGHKVIWSNGYGLM